MSYPDEVTITEVCPRDGFQSMKEHIPVEEKADIINQLIACDFKQIEVTSFVHPKAVPQLKDADELLKHIQRRGNAKFRALIPNLRGLERAIDAGVDQVKLMLSASDSHSISNANCTTEAALKGFAPLVAKARSASVQVSGSISVAFGCPYEGTVPLERLVTICEEYQQLGIFNISLADTVGMGNPASVRTLIHSLRKRFPDFVFSLHLHNTRGMAFANAVAGLEEGIRDFDSSVAGFGGCPYAPNASGNIASEDLIHGFEQMGVQTHVVLDRVLDVARLLHKKYPEYADSFILKAGKCSDLHLAPTTQHKLG